MSLRGILAASFVALAPILALHAQVNAGGLAPGWANAWNGFRVADLALAQVRASQVDEARLSLRIDDIATNTARVAYSKEPLATKAHFVLAMASDSQSHEVLAASRSLNKRERLTGLMLVQMAAQGGEIAKLFPLLDQLSRTEPELSTQLVTILSENLGDPDAVPLIREALSLEPVWASAFWRNVPGSDAALNAFLNLRSDLDPTVDEQGNRNLLARLVANKRFAEAFTVYGQIASATEGTDRSIRADYPPIDWQLSTSREAQARLSGAGPLEIFVEQNAAGELGRKLIALAPGSYSYRSDVSIRQGTGDITASIECAASPERDTTAVSLVALKGQRLRPPGCDYAWLIIRGSAWDSSLPLEATLNEISLEHHP
ncbi:hypothetical protein KUV75_14475 [Qipengyuania gaetbuli]|uniref:hypothetical protein n=1 Tax=Qipengyuania gaetbuli TaxID=266952 RepID=UPI001C99956D|nr:hypothetical protein [Qipengyuania gaetbuli]MBY6016100.1 hypothetical protein [Qipengyuania gaetbuli]